MYPTIDEIKNADKTDLLIWSKYLHRPGMSCSGEKKELESQLKAMNMILYRLNKCS